MRRRKAWVLALAAGVLSLGKGEAVLARPAEGIFPDSDQRRLQEDVTVNGVNLKGATFSEAKRAILENYDWDMRVYVAGREEKVPNLMERRTEILLKELFYGTYELEDHGEYGWLLEIARDMNEILSTPPKEPGIYSFDEETEGFVFEEGAYGRQIDEKALVLAILDAIEEEDFQKIIKAKTSWIKPEHKAEDLKEKYGIIGEFTTRVNPDSNRDQNIALASRELNGLILLPGEEFSFNEATGPRSTEKGYLPATAYLNGQAVQEPGGGVCQVSSTLYNAVIFSGLKTTERWAHTYQPSYVDPGADATVSYGGPDFKFLNSSDYPVGIRMKFADGQLTASIYGIPVLKEGEKVYMESVRDGGEGNVWITYLIRSQDGEETERKRFHTSYYS